MATLKRLAYFLSKHFPRGHLPLEKYSFRKKNAHGSMSAMMKCLKGHCFF